MKPERERIKQDPLLSMQETEAIYFPTTNNAPRYEHEVLVTFCNTNAEGNMSHDEYARLFGVVRELMALEMIPGFKEEAGRKYLLKTKNAFYDYRRDFNFGDKIRVMMGVSEVTRASFTLQAEFVNVDSGFIHAVGRQQIVFANMEGHPKRIPQELEKLLRMMLDNDCKEQ